ncbi:MAG: hypothetical protein ACYC6M_14215 [Terriglobales bacterium]
MIDPRLLSGLGEEPSDQISDRNPYLRLMERRGRTALLTPSGLLQPPELVGVDADARVPNVLQPMSGEFTPQGLVDGGDPTFHNPLMPPATGTASHEVEAARRGKRRFSDER